MKVMLTGAAGQLGAALRQTCPAQVELVALGRGELDITDGAQVLDVTTKVSPVLIVNAAGYTAVDGAETRPDLAVQVNAEGPGLLARAAQVTGARLIHLSTDFVFDGEASVPYTPRAETHPLGVYGHSKLAGECRVREILPAALVLRTAWVYSQHGRNFVKTILQRLAERDELRVVDDQIGAPTWVRGLAQVVWAFAERPQLWGIYHWTDAGQCSWFEFACAIADEARSLGLLQREAREGREVRVVPIPSSDHPTPARRPAYSVLDCATTEDALELRRQPWREQLRRMLEEMKQEPQP